MGELPDEWRFLAEGPQRWEAPPELRTPPRASMRNLLLQIASSDLIGNDILDLTGRLLSSYAALNAWISTEGAGKLGFEGLAKVEVEVSFVTRDVYEAWSAFRDVFAPSRRVGVGDAERAALASALKSGVSRLDQLRTAGSAP